MPNIAGPGGEGEVHREDPQLARGYDGQQALMQGGRPNDLLGVAFTDARPGTKVRYVLLNPGTVGTSFSGQYTSAWTAHIDDIRRSAQPVHEAIAPILKALDDPPITTPPSAFVRDLPLSPHGPAFTLDEARRSTTTTPAHRDPVGQLDTRNDKGLRQRSSTPPSKLATGARRGDEGGDKIDLLAPSNAIGFTEQARPPRLPDAYREKPPPGGIGAPGARETVPPPSSYLWRPGAGGE
ncbi:hypothetical protein [Streptomyces decoyicus]|uniref:hypothetical protein n=1 Tax=Streptomyces decoyicus TaxID=249567 RepID=UPI00386DF6A6|nr:hypothetical protein OG532_38800 [Streptomyces decoyicus]